MAAERIGGGAEQYAMHIDGEELPMHDPKLQPEYHTAYKLDPTPARHTQYEGNSVFGGPEFPRAPKDRTDYSNRGEHHKGASEYMHVINAAGMCQFIGSMAPTERIPEWINLVTGWDITGDELQVVGERIANLRMAFAHKHGNEPGRRYVPGRIWGGEGTVQQAGPLEGVTLDVETLQGDYLRAAGWDVETAKPSRAKLESVGLADVAEEIGAV